MVRVTVGKSRFNRSASITIAVIAVVAGLSFAWSLDERAFERNTSSGEVSASAWGPGLNTFRGTPVSVETPLSTPTAASAERPLELSSADTRAFALSIELTQRLEAHGIVLPPERLLQLANVTLAFDLLRREHEARIAVLSHAQGGGRFDHGMLIVPTYSDYGRVLRDAYFLALQGDLGFDPVLIQRITPAMDRFFARFGQSEQFVQIERSVSGYWVRVHRVFEDSASAEETHWVSDPQGADRNLAPLISRAETEGALL